MIRNKDILDVLTKTRLVEISHHLGFRSWQVVSKGEIVRRLSRQRTTTMEEMLDLLKINELRQICIKLNLNPGGLKKKTIIDRILGQEHQKKKAVVRADTPKKKRVAKPKVKQPQPPPPKPKIIKEAKRPAKTPYYHSILRIQPYPKTPVRLPSLRRQDHRRLPRGPGLP